MKMNMENALPRSGTAVDHHAEPTLGNPLIFSQLIDHGKNLADKTVIFLLQVEERRYVLPRNDQQMNRRFRIDVLKSHDRIVLVDNVAFNIASNDSAK
jgi:hypothetical protein